MGLIGGRETAAFRRGGALPLIGDACVGLRVGVFNLVCLLYRVLWEMTASLPDVFRRRRFGLAVFFFLGKKEMLTLLLVNNEELSPLVSLKMGKLFKLNAALDRVEDGNNLSA